MTYINRCSSPIVLPHERFERAGADLWCLQDLPLTDAVLGTELTVPTLSGTARVKVPAGTQPDTVLRLRGKGLPTSAARLGGICCCACA